MECKMKISDKELFQHVMMGFMTEADPMLAMLKWITEQLMQIEAEIKVGANKNEHTRDRKRYLCFGKVDNEIITVRFVYRNNKIRIFGAGYWRKGKKIYEQNN